MRFSEARDIRDAAVEYFYVGDKVNPSIKNLDRKTRKSIHRAAECLRKKKETSGEVNVEGLKAKIIAAKDTQPSPKSNLFMRIIKSVANVLHLRVSSKKIKSDIAFLKIQKKREEPRKQGVINVEESLDRIEDALVGPKQKAQKLKQEAKNALKNFYDIPREEQDKIKRVFNVKKVNVDTLKKWISEKDKLSPEQRKALLPLLKTSAEDF